MYSMMADGITETQTEQEHQDAVADSEEREAKVHEAIDKMVTSIEGLTDDPQSDMPAASEFETTRPMPAGDPE